MKLVEYLRIQEKNMKLTLERHPIIEKIKE